MTTTTPAERHALTVRLGWANDIRQAAKTYAGGYVQLTAGTAELGFVNGAEWAFTQLADPIAELILAHDLPTGTPNYLEILRDAINAVRDTYNRQEEPT